MAMQPIQPMSAPPSSTMRQLFRQAKNGKPSCQASIRYCARLRKKKVDAALALSARRLSKVVWKGGCSGYQKATPDHQSPICSLCSPLTTTTRAKWTCDNRIATLADTLGGWSPRPNSKVSFDPRIRSYKETC